MLLKMSIAALAAAAALAFVVPMRAAPPPIPVTCYAAVRAAHLHGLLPQADAAALRAAFDALQAAPAPDVAVLVREAQDDPARFVPVARTCLQRR